MEALKKAIDIWFKVIGYMLDCLIMILAFCVYFVVPFALPVYLWWFDNKPMWININVTIFCLGILLPLGLKYLFYFEGDKH